jgi:hypothetical protein
MLPTAIRSRISLVLGVATALFFSACQHVANLGNVAPGDHADPNNPAPTIAETTPRIYYIGTQSMLTFEKKGKPGASDLNIPVYGNHLNPQSNDEQVVLQVSGTVPIGEDEYNWVRPTGKDAQIQNQLLIVINRSYLDRLQTGDRLEVVVCVSAKGMQPAYARRIFTLYEVDDYRKVLEGRVPINDIDAFPLPEAEARYLFGKLIANNYFVVKLSLRNSGSEDKLVNVGMISATGSAIVKPQDDSKPTYIVPIQIPPQSPIQVYAILDEQADFQPRSWVFRSLQFIGALGTATITSYTHIPSYVSKGVPIFTGVAIPAAEQLWPDTWPGYERNLVNFSLPELVKISKLSTTPPKYIFFSKKDLELLISDPTMFDNSSFVPFSTKAITDSKPPAVRVVSLAFDNLDIPFETVTTPGVTDLRETLNGLQGSLSTQLGRLQAAQMLWASRIQFTDGVTFANLNLISSTLSRLATGLDALPATDSTRQAVDELSGLAKILLTAKDPTSALYKSLFTDTGQPVPSLVELQPFAPEVSQLQTRLSDGGDPGPMQVTATTIEKQLDANRAYFEFLMQAATALTSANFVTAAGKLPTDSTKLPAANAPDADRDEVISVFAALRNQRTFRALPTFVNADYVKIPSTKSSSP